MSSRVKNSASAHEVSKVCRKELDWINAADFMVTDLEAVCKQYSSFLCGLLQVTKRPICSVLEEAVSICFPRCPSSDKKAFAERMIAALTYCRRKARNTTSCKRQSEAVRQIIALLPKDTEGQTLGYSLRKRALERFRSDESCKLVHMKPHGSSSNSDPLLDMSPAEISSLWNSSEPPLPLHDMLSQEVLEVSSSQEVQQEATPQEAATAEPPRKIKLQYLDNGTGRLCRVFSDDSRVWAEMRPGDDGFMMAHFGCDEPPIRTEVPILQSKPRAATLKRPAAAVPLSSESDDSDVSDAEKSPRHRDAEAKAAPKSKAKPKAKSKGFRSKQVVERSQASAHSQAVGAESVQAGGSQAAGGNHAVDRPMTYGMMRYPTGAHAVRQKFGMKHQLFQIRKETEADAIAICEAAIKKLHEGVSEPTVKEWAKAQ